VLQINDVFRQIQHAIDYLAGLNGDVTIYDNVTFAETVTFDPDQYATTEIADVAATESAGTSDLIPRGDHVHKADHGSIAGLSDDDHSSLYPLITNFEADRATIATNWEDLTDGGETSLHTHPASSEGSDSDFADGAQTVQPWEIIQSNEDTLRVDNLAQGNAVALRALQPISMGGDPEVTFAQFLTDDDGNVIYG
jgi:hypothetical protein